jgi:hypothetical protein
VAIIDASGNVQSSGAGVLGLLNAWRLFGVWLGAELRGIAAGLHQFT